MGRGRELRDVAESLRRSRLVTLAGPGGVGKTRTALELAHREAARGGGGVWLVDLAPGGAPPPAEEEVARVLGVRVPAGVAPLDALRRALAARGALLVLDNCEAAIDACAELAAGLLAACPRVRVLATSREPLGVPGETVWRLEPLALDDAARLFVERARQARPGYLPGVAEEPVIAALCERLDGLPLAIELAAARVGAMSPREVLLGLEGRLGGLGGGVRGTPAHHRTVRATVEWSHQLLDEDERRALRALAVFAGGFDAAAGEAVAPGLSPERLARLVDKSLVAAARTSRGRTRYRLLESVREYAAGRLAAAGEEEGARRRHLHHFGALAEVARREWLATGRHRFVNELDDDYENVRAAAEWALAQDPHAALRLVTGARDLFFRFGQADGLRLVRRALERCAEPDLDRAEGLLAAGQFAVTLDEHDTARAVLAEARAIDAGRAEPALDPWLRFFQGLSATLAGDLPTARAHLGESRAGHRALGIAVGEARAVAVLGMTFVMAGDRPRGKELLEAALARYRDADDRWGQGQCHTFLGMIADAAPGGAARASAHYRAAADALLPSRDATLLPVALIGQAGVLVRRDPAAALAVAAAAAALRARVGGEFAPFYRSRLDRVREAAEAALGAEAAAAWARGELLPLDAAVALAFGAPRPRGAPGGGLSARELEVARLVGEGLSNKAIAGRLHLSVRTVESHVRHVLGKIGLENRTQIATWARERGQWRVGGSTDDAPEGRP